MWLPWRQAWAEELLPELRLARSSDQPAQLPVAWLVGPRAAPQAFPLLGQARQVAANGEAALWRIMPTAPAVSAALGCPGTPTAGSAAR